MGSVSRGCAAQGPRSPPCTPSPNATRSAWKGGRGRPAAMDQPSRNRLRAPGAVRQVLYPRQDWGKYLEPPCGEILVPRGNIQAWERSPSGLSLSKGVQLTEIAKGVALKVLGTRKLASLLAGDRYYLRVEPAYPENTAVEAAKCLDSGVQCWVFQGEEDADLPENLLPPDIRATNTDSPEEAR